MKCWMLSFENVFVSDMHFIKPNNRKARKNYKNALDF